VKDLDSRQTYSLHYRLNAITLPPQKAMATEDMMQQYYNAASQPYLQRADAAMNNMAARPALACQVTYFTSQQR
jgi:hypothetical protein